MSKVSAIVVSYNEKDYIQRAIDSIIAQVDDHIEIEIIIGDDGSTDGSIELISRLEEQLIADNVNIFHFVMNRPDSSEKIVSSLRVSSIIRKALSMASGDYCVVLSADDLFVDRTKISKAVKFLDEHSDYFSYVSGFKYSDNPKDYIPVVFNSFLFWGHFDYFHISCFVFRMIKPELLLDRIFDDTGLIYTVLKKGKCKADSSVTFEYTQRSGSISHSSSKCDLLLVEAMIVQDILNDSDPRFGFRFATKSREFGFIKELYACRDLLNDERYSHFLSNCREYKNDIVGRIADYKSFSSRLWFCFFFIGVAFDHYFISVLWRLFRMFRKVDA